MNGDDPSELAARVAEVGARHGLWASDAVPVLLVHGDENSTFAVDDLIVRRSARREEQEREVALVRELARATAVPVPVPVLHDPDEGVLAYRRLPGEPLLRQRQRPVGAIVPALADLLDALRRVPSARELPVDAYREEDWHRDARASFAEIRDHLDDGEARLVAAFLDREPPPSRERDEPQHNDLGAEHLLVDGAGRLTGVIDWTDAARADPVRDLGAVHRDLGEAAALRLSAALGHRETADHVARIRFHARCRWLEDAVYAFADPTRRGDYVRNVGWTFERLFGSIG